MKQWKWAAKCVSFISIALLGGAAAGGEGARVADAEVSGSIGDLRFNEIQYIGTHNSYHIAPWPELAQRAIDTGYAESAEWPAAKLFSALDYTHPPLAEQLAMGLRMFELDVHYDPQGGKFSDIGHAAALKRIAPTRYAELDPADQLRKPGFKVFHGGLDMGSRCLLLRDCLQTLKQWSEANPRHFPLVIQIEAKSGAKPAIDDSYAPVTEAPFGPQQWAALENEIVKAIGADKIITPAEVKGRARNLSSAVKRKGWPTLDRMAGRFVLLLLNKKDETISYGDAAPDLPHKLFFTSQQIGSKEAGWFRMPDPTDPQVGRVIRKGFLATVQADTHTLEGRTGSTARRDAAFASGAQFILTDFPTRDKRFTPYNVAFHGSRFVRSSPAITRSVCPIP